MSWRQTSDTDYETGDWECGASVTQRTNGEWAATVRCGGLSKTQDGFGYASEAKGWAEHQLNMLSGE